MCSDFTSCCSSFNQNYYYDDSVRIRVFYMKNRMRRPFDFFFNMESPFYVNEIKGCPFDFCLKVNVLQKKNGTCITRYKDVLNLK